MNLPEADPANSMHNAFVQDWLSRWREANIGEVVEGPGDAFDDSTDIESVIELIQGTYNYQDHEERKTVITTGSDMEATLRCLGKLIEITRVEGQGDINDSLELAYAFVNAVGKINAQES
jgi:hypothetical protein